MVYREAIHLFTDKNIPLEQVQTVSKAFETEIVMFGGCYMLIGDSNAKQLYDNVMAEGKRKELNNP